MDLRRRQLSVAEVNRRLQERREDAAKERLANFPEPRRDRPGGRPPLVMPDWMAKALLEDLEARCSYKWAARKYGVSPPWICEAKKDGRIVKMAEGTYGTPNHP